MHHHTKIISKIWKFLFDNNFHEACSNEFDWRKTSQMANETWYGIYTERYKSI